MAEFLALIPADPSDTFRHCGVDGCSVVSPHMNVVIRGKTWGTYEYLHPWDYEGIDISKLERDDFGGMFPKESSSA